MAQLVKNLPTKRETLVRSLGWEDSLEKGKATLSSILAWRIPWTVYTSWGQKSRTRLSDFHFLLCTLELREGRGGCRPAYTEWWTKRLLHPGSHRALLGINISVAGGDWAPSLRQGTLRLLPLVGGIRLEARSSNQSNLKDIRVEYSLERLTLKQKLQYFGQLMGKTDSLEKTVMLRKIEGRRRRG